MFKLPSNIVSPARWFVIFVAILAFVAIFRDFLAGDEPIIAYSEEEGVEFPIFTGREEIGKEMNDFKWQIMPLIPYDPQDVTTYEQTFLPPLSQGQVENSYRYYHWLGTDGLGRDVMAGIIYGCRIAILIGLLSGIVALLIGYFLGAIAGYYGDSELKVNWIILVLIGIISVVYVYSTYWSMVRGIPFSVLNLLGYILALIIFFYIGLTSRSFKTTIPVDFLIMRGVDLMSSVPVLLVLLVISVALHGWNVVEIAFLIGILGWPTLCRHVRAEVRELTNSEEVEYAKGLGFSDTFILSKRIFMRSIQAALVVLAFVTGGSIVLEATLSFLGLGLPADTISWGNLIHQTRANPSAWWLVGFPGILLFLIVYGLNQWGRKMNEAVNQGTR